MDFAQLSQLGIGFATLGILLLVVRYFIATTNRKDADTKELINQHLEAIQVCSQKVETISIKYSETVNNHMAHHTEIIKEQTKTLERLTKLIEKIEHNH